MISRSAKVHSKPLIQVDSSANPFELTHDIISILLFTHHRMIKEAEYTWNCIVLPKCLLLLLLPLVVKLLLFFAIAWMPDVFSQSRWKWLKKLTRASKRKWLGRPAWAGFPELEDRKLGTKWSITLVSRVSNQAIWSLDRSQGVIRGIGVASTSAFYLHLQAVSGVSR